MVVADDNIVQVVAVHNHILVVVVVVVGHNSVEVEEHTLYHNGVMDHFKHNHSKIIMMNYL